MDGKRTFLFVLEVAPMEEGQIYLNLPLHCTLARFATDTSAEQILAKTWPIFAKTAPLNLYIGSPSRFGSSKRPHRVEVNLVEKTPELDLLQMRLYGALNQLGVQYSNASYVGEAYRPHVSKRGNSELSEGEICISRAVYFIEVQPSAHSSSKKFIYARLSLST